MKKFLLNLAYTYVVLVSLVSAAMLWGFAVEPWLLPVTELEIVDARVPQELDGARAVFFSDLHAGFRLSGAKTERVASMIKALDPDIVFFGGDLTQREAPVTRQEADRFAAAFAGIQPRFGKYAVLGNHDWWPEEMRDVARDMLAGGGFTILENGSAEPVQGFLVAGAKPWPEHLDGGLAGIFRQAGERGAFTVVLAHEPVQADDWSKLPAALQLSGHTHYGQVALPFAGPLEETYATEGYYGGKYLVNDTVLYVTRGVGVIDMHVRFFAPPEIVVVTFRKER